ncbi:C8orf76 [Branchiostoma lanceolatum]|uniref:C8orf76 protein n=1 Tax=Branchiostoma lanceolatum TaxID=7740 RepID=A0A8J9ZHG3_BRALA|nr:C8orf76 [Branchiostoma lanceolatum]
MEDFGGLSFDDSLFCGGNVRESRRLVSYNAKICEEGWFTQNVALHQKADVERLDVQKFSADQLYYQRDYRRALVIYRDMLGSIPPSNATVRRDVEEAIARCSLNLGEADAALDIALDMEQLSVKGIQHQGQGSVKGIQHQRQGSVKGVQHHGQGIVEGVQHKGRGSVEGVQHQGQNKSVNPNNPDQQTVVWSLLRDVYKQMGKAQEYMRIQQDLVTLHPQNAHCWVLLQETGKGCTSFCWQKNKKLQTNILRQLADMGVPEHVVTEATKFLENRNEADTNIDTKSSDGPLEEQQDTFEDRWLSWASCLQMG